MVERVGGQPALEVEEDENEEDEEEEDDPKPKGDSLYSWLISSGSFMIWSVCNKKGKCY